MSSFLENQISSALGSWSTTMNHITDEIIPFAVTVGFTYGVGALAATCAKLSDIIHVSLDQNQLVHTPHNDIQMCNEGI